MSRDVEQKVVEMQFDNAKFERNVSQTMSTLDKLKEKLQFKKSSKALEDLADDMKKVDTSGLSKGLTQVEARFSSLQVVGATVLANITNSAMAAGRRIVSALTLDPVLSGFREYETQINAIQTILANTSKDGTTLEDVTSALDELNLYADQTIYNFTEMTRNIGTFTAAGVKLDTSVEAIKGIANIAAISGSSSQQASNVMYQLSQALAAGRVTLQDWNSVVNAGMGGKIFQDALMETAEAMGIVVDRSISFRESISAAGGGESWLTSDVLLNTLRQFTGDMTDAELAAIGFNETQIESIQQMAKTAQGAATEVKTITQLIDTTKEAIQSGWTQTWELILGDFDQAKELFTEISDGIGSIVQRFSDTRNSVLEGALTSKWSQLVGQITEAGIAEEEFEKAVTDVAIAHGVAVDRLIEQEGSLDRVISNGAIGSDLILEALQSMAGQTEETAVQTEDLTEKLEEFQKVVHDVWQGEYANGEERVRALTDAGYDYVEVQELVNKTANGQILTLEDLSDAQLESIGYTEEQIASIRDLAAEASKSGTSLNQLIEDISRPSGRDLLIDSFRNSLEALSSILGVVRDAWEETFPPLSIEERSEQLYDLIERIHSFTEGILDAATNSETIDKLTRTLNGLFAIIDIITTLVGGGFRFGFKILSNVLGLVDVDILDITAHAGDALVAFRDWLFEGNAVVEFFQVFGSGLSEGIAWIREWIDAFLDLPIVQDTIGRVRDSVGDAVDDLGEHWSEGIERIHAFSERVRDMDSLTLDGFIAMLKDFKENVVDYFFDVGDIFGNLEDNFKDAYENLKKYFTGIGNFLDWLGTSILDFGKDIGDFLGGIGVGEILAIALGGTVIVFAKNLADAISLLASPIKGFSDILDGLSGSLKAYSTKVKAEAIFTIAKAIALMAASIALLALLDIQKVGMAAGVLVLVAAAIVGLSAALGKLNNVKGSLGSAGSIASIAMSLLILSGAMKMLDGLDQTSITSSLNVLLILAASLVVLSAALTKFGPSSSAGAVSLLAMVGSLLLMVQALEDISELNISNLGQTIAILLTSIVSLRLLASSAGEVSPKGFVSMLTAIVSLKLLIGALEDIMELDTMKMKANLDAFVAIFGMFSLLMVSSAFAGQNAAKAGVGIMAMSASLLLIVLAFKMISDLDAITLQNVTESVSQLLVVFGLIVALSNFAGKHAAQAGAMLLMMSGAILVLAGVIAILANIDPDGLTRAVAAIAVLEILLGGIVAATGLIKADIAAPLTRIAIAVGLLSVAVAGLSLIDSDKLIGATASLSMLMGAFSLIVASTAIAKKANSTLVVITAVVAALAGMLGLLSLAPIESNFAAAGSLAILLTSMSAALVILSNVRDISQDAYTAMGVMVLIVGALGGVLSIMTAMNVDISIETAIALSTLLLTMSGVCVILGEVGKTGKLALVGGGILLAVIGVLGLVMLGIGALFNGVNGLETTLDKGLNILVKIGEGLGRFIGAIGKGIVSEFSSALPDVGDDLSAFMTNVTPFVNGVRNVDGDVLLGVGNLVGAVLALTGANLVDAIGQILSGGRTLGEFGAQLVPFGESVVAFSDILKEGDIDADMVDAAANAASALAEMAKELPNSGGILGKFFGENDMDDFGSQLESFGEALVAFGGSVEGLNTEDIQAAAEAGTALATMADTIPNSGGELAKFFGENDMEDFAEDLPKFGEALKKYGEHVAGLNVDDIKLSAEAGTALTALADTIPNSGGILGKFFGENDMDDFGSQLESFGNALVEYSLAVVDADIDAIKRSSEVGAPLVELANTIPNTGGLVEAFTGSNDMNEFGQNLISFGDSLTQYSNALSGMKPNLISLSVEAGHKLAELIEALPEDKFFKNETWLGEFGEQISEFGAGFAEFYNLISVIDPKRLSSVVDSVTRLVDMAVAVNGVDLDGLTQFGQSLTKLGETGIDGFLSAFQNGDQKAQQAVYTLVMVAAHAVRSEHGEFYNAGVYLVSGLVSGMDNYRGVATTSARLLATSIVSTIRNTLQIQSPSVVMTEIGEYIVQGLTEGITGDASAEQAASQKATNISEAFQKEFELLDLADTRAELEADLYGESIDYAEQYNRQLQRVKLSYGEYQNSVKELGEESAEAQQAYNDYLEQEITLRDMAAERAAAAYEATLEAIQSEMDLIDVKEERLSLEQELNGETEDYETQRELQLQRLELATQEYNETLAQYGEDAIETQQAYNALLQEEIDLRSIAEAQAQASYENSLNWIEQQREAEQLSLIDELAAYRRLQPNYAEGTSQRVEIDESILDVEQQIADATKEYYDTLAEIQIESNQQRLELNQEYEDSVAALKEQANEQKLQIDQDYADREQEINDQLEANIDAANQAYEDAVKSRADTLYNSYGLFDAVDYGSKYVSGAGLLENLQTQVDALENWSNDINSLADRGLDAELLDELREMGPSSAVEIKALSEMTDEQLDEYVALWQNKHALAKDQATYELQDLLLETNETIEQLKEDSEIKLEENRLAWAEEIQLLNEQTEAGLQELKNDWLAKIDELNTETSTKLQEVQETWMVSVVGLKTETENAFVMMTQNLINILGEQSQWTITGSEMIEGVLTGIAAKTPSLITGVESAMQAALAAANQTLGIASPSKKFAEVGRYVAEGFAQGVDRYSNVAVDSVDRMDQETLSIIWRSVTKISEMINNGIDVQPTICPVVDLSDVSRKSKQMKSIFRGAEEAMEVGSLVTAMRNQNGTSEASETVSKTTPIVNQFTQNNYSPKALSRVDIYRQTKNQFSAFERMVNS